MHFILYAMNTKLVDFSAEQLQLLLNALENYRSDIKNGYFLSKSLEDSALVDDLNLLRVQLLTAIGQVQMNQRTVNN